MRLFKWNSFVEQSCTIWATYKEESYGICIEVKIWDSKKVDSLKAAMYSEVPQKK